MMDNFEDQIIDAIKKISDKDQMQIEFLELSQRMLQRINL